MDDPCYCQSNQDNNIFIWLKDKENNKVPRPLLSLTPTLKVIKFSVSNIWLSLCSLLLIVFQKLKTNSYFLQEIFCERRGMMWCTLLHFLNCNLYAFDQSSSSHLNSFFFHNATATDQVIKMDSSSSDLSTTEATATTGDSLPPSAIPDVQVLIPQSYPGAFYYPPCKCDLVNQVKNEWAKTTSNFLILAFSTNFLPY